jgi:ribosomal protein S27E
MYGKKKSYLNWNELMSIRCKVCNTAKIIVANKLTSDVNWECQTCGNTLDVNGHIVASNLQK